MSKAAQFKTTCLRDSSLAYRIQGLSRHSLPPSLPPSLPTYLPTYCTNLPTCLPSYLTSANSLICLLILSPTTTIFKPFFRSFAALKCKLADVRRNDVIL